MNAKEIMPSNGSFAANQFIRYESKPNGYAWPSRLLTFIFIHLSTVIFISIYLYTHNTNSVEASKWRSPKHPKQQMDNTIVWPKTNDLEDGK